MNKHGAGRRAGLPLKRTGKASVPLNITAGKSAHHCRWRGQCCEECDTGRVQGKDPAGQKGWRSRSSLIFSREPHSPRGAPGGSWGLGQLTVLTTSSSLHAWDTTSLTTLDRKERVYTMEISEHCRSGPSHPFSWKLVVNTCQPPLPRGLYLSVTPPPGVAELLAGRRLSSLEPTGHLPRRPLELRRGGTHTATFTKSTRGSQTLRQGRGGRRRPMSPEARSLCVELGREM